MKKVIALSFIVAACYACGNNAPKETGTAPSADNTATKEEAKPAPVDDLSKNPDYQKGLELIAKSDCLTCHKVEEMSTGPAYRDVANKYPNDEKTLDMLTEKILKGGSGNWGQVPMTPHANMKPEEAKQIVKYIMLLKNK
jgi:cytochrome c